MPEPPSGRSYGTHGRVHSTTNPSSSHVPSSSAQPGRGGVASLPSVVEPPLLVQDPGGRLAYGATGRGGPNDGSGHDRGRSGAVPAGRAHGRGGHGRVR